MTAKRNNISISPGSSENIKKGTQSLWAGHIEIFIVLELTKPKESRCFGVTPASKVDCFKQRYVKKATIRETYVVWNLCKPVVNVAAPALACVQKVFCGRDTEVAVA